MTTFDDKYTIRLANENDIDTIMKFIEKEWKNDHIFALDREYFCYEHQFGKQVNYMLALDKETGELEGIMGFIEASQDIEHKDVWGVMWKVRNNNLPFLGVELLKRIMKLTKCRSEIGVGANIKTSIPILQVMMKFEVAKMNHFYRLSDSDNYRIAKIIKKPNNYSDFLGYESSLILFSQMSQLLEKYDLKQNINQIPYKDAWYIRHRYFEHPIYHYDVWGILREDNEIGAVLVTREICVNNSKILRIVDYIGVHSLMSGLKKSIQDLINANGYEYIDCYCYGFDENYMYNAGFTLRDEHDKNIIPNYFEPYVPQNVDIWVNSSVKGVTFFKADGDQDRPNYRNHSL